LSFVGRRLHSERVASLLTMRDTPNAPERFEGLRRIPLEGLSTREAHALLTTRAGGLVDELVADHLVAATGGNPLALVELPAVLTVEQLRGTSPLPDPLPVGQRLAGLFATRLAALDADARMVVLLASAERLGDPTLLHRAADAIGGLSWDDAVTTAESSGLLAFSPKVAFRHPLVRSVVYYSASPSDRRRAHAALAEALDAELDADRRAWHLGAAAGGPDEQIARLLEVSAERARQRGGASAAALLLWRSAELTPDPQRATGRLLEAARAELVGGRGPRAQEILDRARATGLAARHHAEVAWTEALIHMVAGEVRQAAAAMPEALPLIAADQPELGVGACVAAVAAALSGGHLIERPARQAIAAGTRDVARLCDLPEPIASVVAGLADVLSEERGAADETLRLAVMKATRDQARLQAVAGRRVHVVYFDTILAAAEVLDDRAWGDLADEWALLARRIGALSTLPSALSLCSWLEVLQGRLASAASHLAEIDDVVSLTGARGLLGSPPPALVWREAWRGNEEATRTGARRMMQDAHERGQGIAIDHAYAALTVLELGAGRYDAALRAGRHVLDHDSVVLGTLVLPDVVEAAVRCGDSVVAEQALDRLAERATASATPWVDGLLARGRALVASGDEADTLFRSALDNLSGTTIATETARTQLLHGEWLRRARRRKEAREPLHDAVDFFESIGASAFAARGRAELAATGEQLRTRSAPVDVLTPQEAQVARLAASGERNRDIAAQLYISTSTVEYHLRKIFVKLGVTSRTQLAQVDLPT
jgi:DNA-binding CsgD family transcriptional regulator